MRDIVRAFCLALEREDVADVGLNVGTGRATSIATVARLLGEVLGVAYEPEIVGKFRDGDIRHCVGDIALIKRTLGYDPTIRLEAGILDLAEWAKSQHAVDRVDQATAELEAKGLVR